MHTSRLLCALLMLAPAASEGPRPRARDLGIAPGVFEPGPFNAITDVPGVLEEAVDNSLLRATTVTGSGRTVRAIPLDAVRRLLRR